MEEKVEDDFLDLDPVPETPVFDCVMDIKLEADPTSKIVTFFQFFKTIESVISFLNASAGPVEKVWKATAKISLQAPHRDLE